MDRRKSINGSTNNSIKNQRREKAKNLKIIIVEEIAT